LRCLATDVACMHPDEKIRHKYFQMIIKNQNLEEIKAEYLRRKTKSVWNAVERIENSAPIVLDNLEDEYAGESSDFALEEMMVVYAIILDHGPHQTIRRRWTTREVGSTCFIKDVLQWMASACPSVF
uniref:Ras-GEF domain-containing protein n=1 Tax=Toxocara canis TaxID=6265 RepID=A0A183VHJ6_TOXCA